VLVVIVGGAYIGARPVIEAAKSGDPDVMHLFVIRMVDKVLPDELMFEFVKGGTDSGKRAWEFTLGEYYEQGKGVKKNAEKAVTWYRKAAEQGYEPAIEALKRLGSPLPEASSEPASQASEPKAEEPKAEEPNAEEAAPKAEENE